MSNDLFLFMLGWTATTLPHMLGWLLAATVLRGF
jgi:hypothetical protein